MMHQCGIICQSGEVIGNIFDNPELVEKYNL